MTEAVILYDNGLRHERVKLSRNRVSMEITVTEVVIAILEI